MNAENHGMYIGDPAPPEMVKAIASQADGLSSLALWWHMVELQYELVEGKRIPDDTTILSFMGSGGSHRVTVEDLRAAFPRMQSEQA